ncbi:IclR family transcriptional regulator [Limisalsivibrio acetivorans]|uniref:IclR family transcriptional regulator n=1 Tax=Limisalsivibrio acetivorans TaxID=1304888 RepID=UPI0003B45F82|nr:IclR family transcriptional regulator [Limisalsivibrio acetivorans]
MPATSSSVEKALQILTCFTGEERELSLGDICSMLNISKPSVYRLCSTLTAEGFLTKDSRNQTYRLGIRMLELANIYLNSASAPTSIQQIMKELGGKIGETVTIYRLAGLERKCIMRHEAETALRVSVSLGQKLPLHLGATGKVILAYAPKVFFNAYLSGVDISNSYPDPSVLEKQLTEVRERGYAVTLGERDPYLAAVAVPLFDAGGDIFGSLSVSAPLERFKINVGDAEISMVQEYGRKLNSFIPLL